MRQTTPGPPGRLAAADWNERALFFRHWLRRPLAIGAVLPSGRAVGRAMARHLPERREGIVLELGGGTGSVTEALLEAGCGAAELIVFEREPALAATLRRRFPQLQIVEADARRVGAVLTELGVASLAGVVSSIPIKWFDIDGQRAVVEACFARLGGGGALLQMTNALCSPLPMRALGIDGNEVARLWTHIPPVQIWRYRRAATPGGSR